MTHEKQAYKCPVCFRQFNSQHGRQCHIRDRHRRHEDRAEDIADPSGSNNQEDQTSLRRHWRKLAWLSRCRQWKKLQDRRSSKADVESTSTRPASTSLGDMPVQLVDTVYVTDKDCAEKTHTHHWEYGGSVAEPHGWNSMATTTPEESALGRRQPLASGQGWLRDY